MDASGGRLVGEAVGEVEDEDGVLVVKRIHVRYVLRVGGDVDRAKVRRAFDAHPAFCPVYRSVTPSIEITTELELVEG